MKKPTACFLFTFLSFSVFCQNKEWLYDFYTLDGIEYTSTGEYVISPSINFASGSSTGSHLFKVFDDLGNEIPVAEIPPVDYGNMEEITNGYLFSTTKNFECDYRPEGGGLVKFDLAWNLEWATMFEDLSILSATENSLGDIYAIGSLSPYSFDGTSTLVKLNSFGDVIWTKHFPDTKWYDILNNNNDTLVVASKEGLVLLDTVGEIISVLENFVFHEIKISSVPEYFGINDEEVVKLSAGFDSLGALDINWPEILNVNIPGEKICIVHPSLENTKVRVYDLDLQLTTDFVANNDAQFFNAVTTTSDEIIVVGHELYGSEFIYNNTAALLKSFDYDGNNIDYGLDAGIVGISLPKDGELIKSSFVTPPGDTFFTYYHRFDSVSLVIKNFGNSAINQVRINNRLFPDYGPPCQSSWNSSSKFFDDLNLLPGEETSVYWGLLIASNQDPDDDFQKLCFWTSTPNNKTDGNIENDLWCEDVMVISGTKEKITNETIKLFPNPVSDKLFFDLNNIKVSGFSIFNNYGQLVLNGKLNTANNGINVAGLSSGIYFIKIETAKGVLLDKFVKH
ncbi:MAG TPA: T9SS type A sorting domain-containing protein [Bacteroidetes bacterium]|nr:T9SS type A sorting domain-containing protein [Bacteroidota bacterium]